MKELKEKISLLKSLERMFNYIESVTEDNIEQIEYFTSESESEYHKERKREYELENESLEIIKKHLQKLI